MTPDCELLNNNSRRGLVRTFHGQGSRGSYRWALLDNHEMEINDDFVRRSRKVCLAGSCAVPAHRGLSAPLKYTVSDNGQARWNDTRRIPS